jgi:multimeric flavodoxin WrbA
MKIICLLGSPRPKGNSTALAKRFCDVAERLGATVQSYFLSDLKYGGCTGCETCKTRLDRCVLKDDLSGMLDSIHLTDILILSSPIYYGDVSSQLKAFIDRTFSWLVPDYVTNPIHSRLPSGKKLVFILTQANTDKTLYADVFLRYNHFFNWYYGFEESHLIRACGVRNLGDVEKQDDVMRLAEATAKGIVR